MKRVLIRLFLLLSIVGILNVVLSMMFALCLLSPKMELPILGVSDIGVADNEFFIASSFNSRVQEYDSTGNYVGRISVLNYAKPFSFDLYNRTLSGFRILPQGIVNVEKPKIIFKGIEVLYLFNVKGYTYYIRQPMILHLFLNPISGVFLCFVGLLGTLAVNDKLRNRLLFVSPVPRSPKSSLPNSNVSS